MTAPVLVFGYGNPSRGDDALGPEFVRRLETLARDAIASGSLEVLTDYQLQVEHALDLKGRRTVYFVDACRDPSEGVSVRPVRAERDPTFTSHLLSPQALLHTYSEVEAAPPPEAFLIAIAGGRFELGEPLSDPAARNLELALETFENILRELS